MQSLPDRNTLKKIVVKVEETTEKGEIRRVTDNSQSNTFRQTGESSHSLFDRDDIVNGRRLFSDIEQNRRFSHRSNSVHSHQRNGSRINHKDYRRDFRESTRERMRSRDDLLLRSRRGLCHFCHSILDHMTDCLECCRKGRRRRIYRTLSSEELTRTHSVEYQDFESTELGTFYIYQEPSYYAVWESTPSLAMYDFEYYSLM